MRIRGLTVDVNAAVRIIIVYYLHVRVGVNHTSMIHNFAYAEHDKQDYDRGKMS